MNSNIDGHVRNIYMVSNMTKYKILSAAAGLLMSLSGPSVMAAPAADFAPTAESAAATHMRARPALWKVMRGDTTIYLFGTVHALPGGIDWFDGPVARAFGGSDELVTEILDKSPEQMRDIITAKARLPEGHNLRDMMTGHERHVFEQALEANGLPANAFDRFQPWYAAVALSTMPLPQSGYDAANGVDARLSTRAKAAGQEHVALETAEFQLGLFAGLPMATQTRYLNQVVASLPKVKGVLANMVQAWRAGQADRLAKLLNADNDDPKMRQLLLLGRNKAWAKWIDSKLCAAHAKPETLFIAVGAGHLAGEGSLLDQLQQRGIRAARVQ